MKNLFLSVLLLYSLPTYAGGGKAGEGGHASCSQFTTAVGKIVMALADFGQEEINKVKNNLIDIDEIKDVKRRLQCEPVTQLDRQARSSFETKRTKLLVAEYDGITPWEDMTAPEQQSLAAHELAVLSGYESEYEYYVSEVILQILEMIALRSNHIEVANLLKHQNWTHNHDGDTVTIIDPTYILLKDNDLVTHVIGFQLHSSFEKFLETRSDVCKHFNKNWEQVHIYSEIGNANLRYNFAWVDISGHIRVVKNGRSKKHGEDIGIVKSVTCKPNFN